MNHMPNMEGIPAEPQSPEQRLWAAVVLSTIDEAIERAKSRKRDGPERIARWARTQDGRTVLRCAGIEPSERVAEALAAFVRKGVTTAKAFADPERRAEHGRAKAREAMQ